ncbi:Uncharacterised protein [Bordetella pertussis]|nr:Uncharacterised protein [Bordetella pertussis]
MAWSRSAAGSVARRAGAWSSSTWVCSTESALGRPRGALGARTPVAGLPGRPAAGAHH